MSEGCILSLLENPYFWSGNILVFVLLPSVAGMLFGGREGHSSERTWAYRETGVEIASILIPFALYSAAHSLNGSFQAFLITPELPMAASLMVIITSVSLLKAASAAKGAIPTPALLVLNFCATILFILFTVLVFWLTGNEHVSAWFSVLNSATVVVAAWFSFAISAAMNYISKHPKQAIS